MTCRAARESKLRLGDATAGGGGGSYDVSCMVALQVVMLGVCSASAVPVELSGGSWTLEVTLDQQYPKGMLTKNGETFRLIKPKLSLRTTLVEKDAVTTEYRLQFGIDQCAHAKPTPPGEWPGPCAYPDGAAPPVRLQLYDLLVQRRKSGANEKYTATCVPTSGEGPSCRLQGEVGPPPKTASR